MKDKVDHNVGFKSVLTITVPSEWAAVVFELKNRPSPRSPNFTTAEAVTNTLAGLMSV